MKKWWVLGAFVSAMVVSFCVILVSQDRILKIDDVTKAQVLVLKEQNKPKTVHGLTIKMEGFIDGLATLERFEGNRMVSTSVINGKINSRFHGDWYMDTCRIIYKPIKIKSGSLTFKYKFNTL